MKKLKLLSVVLAMLMVMSFAFTACTPDDKPAKKTYTYKTYTTVSPSNWNELTYEDNNDTQIMSYIGSALFEYDFKFDANGEIVPGDFDVEYSFATALEDVSDEYNHAAGSGYAWKITIRDDGKWDDGTLIKASDFEYTMQAQLDPEFKNHRADSFYNGATVIVNAENYVFQGTTKFVGAHTRYEEWEVAKASPAVKFSATSNECYVNNWFLNNYGSQYYDRGGEGTGWSWIYAGLGIVADPLAVSKLDGKTWAEIEADAELKATWDAIIGWWQTDPNEELHFFGTDYTYPAVDWKDVGFKSNDEDNTITLVLAKPLQLLKKDGSLSYKAAYNMSSLPLVHRAKYEDSVQEPVEGSSLKTSKYNSSLATTASWGPYMLTEFQAGKMYKLEKNPHWYGWNMEKYDGLYQTTHIVCETVAEYETNFMNFLKGNLTGIGIDVSKADEYKNSDRAYFTPDDFVSSLQLQSSYTGLKNRESDGVNKTILAQADFRKALSLGINRDKYTKATTTSSLAGFGLFNSMHYYDVENGKAYRESDAAKKVLCEVYGVDYTQYPDLDAAVDSITGYDLVQAKALVNSAVVASIEAGDLKGTVTKDADGAIQSVTVTDKVVLTYGTSEENEVTQRNYSELSAMYDELMKGTYLEGKFELEFNASFGTKWADDFKDGAYDICAGGWTGAAWDPGYLLMAYLDAEKYAYSAEWDTTKETMTFTIKGVKGLGEQKTVLDDNDVAQPVVDGLGVAVEATEVTNNADDSFTATYDLMTWWDLLNGDWQSGALDEQFRLDLIAALEKVVLEKFYSVPISYSFGASLISYQVDYITYEYNTFMGYGGMKYMTYNYDDAAWAEWVASHTVGGEIDYKS